MEYVKLGSNNVSRLGFGCMRLPENNTGIDYDEALRMAEYAINNGINYFDTAYVYHSGNSETFVRKAIEKFGRDKIFVADKLPMFNVRTAEDFQKYLDEQLERLGTDYIDYYLFHCLGTRYFNMMKEFNYKDFIKKNKENGKIRHIGFSFHDNLDSFKEIIDDYNWDFCQIQLNYLDVDYQAGLSGYEYATEREIPVIVMEPIRGGELANIPTPIREIFDTCSLKNYSNAEIALKFVGNLENSKVILSGMHAMEELEENIKLFNDNLINTLNTDEKIVYALARRKFYNYKFINCTGCDYCKENCPSRIPISEIFLKYNSDVKEPSWANSGWYKKLNANADHCIGCGACESTCPQQLKIVENLQIVHEHFND